MSESNGAVKLAIPFSAPLLLLITKLANPSRGWATENENGPLATIPEPVKVSLAPAFNGRPRICDGDPVGELSPTPSSQALALAPERIPLSQRFAVPGTSSSVERDWAVAFMVTKVAARRQQVRA